MSKNINSTSFNFTIYLIIILILCGSIFSIFFQKSANLKNKNPSNNNELDEGYIFNIDDDVNDMTNVASLDAASVQTSVQTSDPYKNITLTHDPAADIILDKANYKDENSTQFNFNRLFDSLKKINKEKKTLKGPTN